MFLPNFFLIGAPKCGTTALYHALIQHPDIFMGQVKEPCFFAFGGRRPEPQPVPGGGYLSRAGVWKAEEYLRLYAAGEQYQMRGDASTLYLRSPEAAAAIKASIPQAKIIAILRQPAERAYSGYHYAVNNRIEHAATFAKAIAEEPDRVAKGWFSGLYHRQNGFYFAQLCHYYTLFPREQIKVYLYEDWNESPDRMLLDLFRFLGVDPHFQPKLRRSNVTQVPRNSRLHRLAYHPRLRAPRGPLSALEPMRHALASILLRLDRQYNQITPPPLPKDLRRVLTDGYSEDITQLQALIGRDLSHWLH